MASTELVTTLKRKATKIITGIRKSKQPVLITQHGIPAAYLVDVKTFENLHARIEILEGIARGEVAAREGRVVPHAQARRRMKRWLR